MELLTPWYQAILQKEVYARIDQHAQEVVLGNRPPQKIWIDLSAGFTAMIPVKNETIEATQLRGKIFAKLDVEFEAGDRFQLDGTHYEILGMLVQNGMWKEGIFYAYQ